MDSTPEHPPARKAGKTIDIAGHKVKQSTALLAAGAVAVIAVVVIRKRSASTSAAAASSAGTVTDPAGNVCASLDPATGYCPGTAADTAAQQAAAVNSSADTADTGDGGGSGYYYEPATTGTSPTGSAVPAFTDNASWGQYAETALGSNGSDAIAAAIAKYLSGQPVTEAQQTTIEEAIAIANKPPVAGANGNPPSMTLTSTPPATAPPAPGAPTSVKVPGVVGDDVVNASSALQSAGLLMSPEVPAAKGKTHIVTGQKPAKGATAAKGSTVTITYRTT